MAGPVMAITQSASSSLADCSTKPLWERAFAGCVGRESWGSPEGYLRAPGRRGGWRHASLKKSRTHPFLIEPLASLLATMVRETVVREVDQAFLDLRGRLARKLLDLSADTNDPFALSRGNRVTQSELAQMVGASRQRVHATLHALHAEGLIQLHDSGITVLSRSGLCGAIRGQEVSPA